MLSPVEMNPTQVRLQVASDRWLENVSHLASGAGAREVVVDLSAVRQIGSRELNQLVRLQLRLKASGRALVVENAQDTVRNVFLLTRLDRLVEIRESVAAESGQAVPGG